MKIKIILTSDDGKTYEGEVNLSQNLTPLKRGHKQPPKGDEQNFKGIAGGIRLLMKNGFLDTPKSVKEITSELNREGYFGKQASIDKLLRVDFTNKNKQLTRIKSGSFWNYVIRK